MNPPPIPDWFVLRALLLHDVQELTDSQLATLTLHRWLLIKQGWAIGPCAMSPQTGLPISADIEAITLDGFDWASLLADKVELKGALENLAARQLTPSTWLLREILLTTQIGKLQEPSATTTTTTKKGRKP